MKMTNKTATAIAAARQIFGSYEFTANDWECAQLGCTLTTAIQHNAVKKISRTRRVYYTTKELVEMLNGCSGEDCYYSFWYLKVDEHDRAYEDLEEEFYQLVERV